MIGSHANPDGALEAAAEYQRRARTLLQVARAQLGLERIAAENEAIEAAAPGSRRDPVARRTRRASAGGGATTR